MRRIRSKTYFGEELVPRPRRMALMNLYLHGIEPQIRQRDVMDPSGDDPVDPPDCRCKEAWFAAGMDLDLGEILLPLVCDRELRGDRNGILMECGTDPLGQNDLYVNQSMHHA